MTDRVSIPHYGGDVDRPAPWWRPFAEGAPVVQCPCGLRTQLDHEIDDDGTVNPSILCPDCGWHVWGRLEGW